jgi:hypothetical protein
VTAVALKEFRLPTARYRTLAEISCVELRIPQIEKSGSILDSK